MCHNTQAQAYDSLTLMDNALCFYRKCVKVKVPIFDLLISDWLAAVDTKVKDEPKKMCSLANLKG